MEISGYLQKQGVTTYQYGSHVLNDSEGKTLYALTSEEVNLDMYTGRKVTVIGLKIEGYPVDGGPEYLRVSKLRTYD